MGKVENNVKMCPKRKSAYSGVDKDGWSYTTEEFLPCIQEKCAWWDAKGGCVPCLTVKAEGEWHICNEKTDEP